MLGLRRARVLLLVGITDLRPRNVRDVNLAREGNHVVLAQAVNLDVLDQDHLVVVLLEHRPVHDAGQALAVPSRARQQGLRHPLGRLDEALPRHVFAQALQQGGASLLHLVQAFLVVVRLLSPRRFSVEVGHATPSLHPGPCCGGSAVARVFPCWASRAVRCSTASGGCGSLGRQHIFTAVECGGDHPRICMYDV